MLHLLTLSIGNYSLSLPQTNVRTMLPNLDQKSVQKIQPNNSIRFFTVQSGFASKLVFSSSYFILCALTPKKTCSLCLMLMASANRQKAWELAEWLHESVIGWKKSGHNEELGWWDIVYAIVVGCYLLEYESNEISQCWYEQDLEKSQARSRFEATWVAQKC